MRSCFLFYYVFTLPIALSAQQQFSGKNWKIIISPQGAIQQYISLSELNSDTISFRKDKLAGPSFEGVTLKSSKVKPLIFSGSRNTIDFSISYENINGDLAITATITNSGKDVYIPKYERLLLGLNTYMDKYPAWNYIFFPTMLRGERNHFMGYAMTPSGRILAMASPQPVASWNYEYMNTGNIEGHPKAILTGHRIYTVSFDLLHQLPLPTRHPQHLTNLKPGEKVKFTLLLRELKSITELNSFYLQATNAPVIEIKQHSVAQYEKISGLLKSNVTIQQAICYGPNNYAADLPLTKTALNEYTFSIGAERGAGNYRMVVTDSKGMQTEATVFFRNDWAWYLKQARTEALKSKPTTTHHAECFYPLYTYFLAKKYLPDKQLDDSCEAVFQKIFYVLYDTTAGEMRDGKFRIQDAATMVGVLSDRFEALGNVKDMEYAAALVDFLIKTQRADVLTF